jgi:hypothetical protein
MRTAVRGGPFDRTGILARSFQLPRACSNPPLQFLPIATFGQSLAIWRLRFVMEDCDLAVALPQFNIVTEYDSKSTVATKRQMRPASQTKERPVRAAFGRMSRVST